VLKRLLSKPFAAGKSEREQQDRQELHSELPAACPVAAPHS
jgi:hypothetical protein